MSASVDLTLFTDPACPFAFSAEPVRQTLRWQYGDQLRWTTRLIVLTREPGEAEKLAGGADGLQRLCGMPIARSPHERPASSEPACRAVIAARLHAAAEIADSLLRRLRVRTMAGGLLDDPELIGRAAVDVGLDLRQLATWADGDDVAAALEADAAASRSPTLRARALDHRLGGPPAERRYSAPSYELALPDGTAVASVPGFNPVPVYEIALANLAPSIERQPPPESVVQLLSWADGPLATAEVAAVMRLEIPEARRRLKAANAVWREVGADGYWTLP
jgi:2-hydroxychromene-2-carboxylate isomerase